MSDLISKRSLLVYLRNWQDEQFAGIEQAKEYNLLERLIHGIENEPAISEKEIRDKAIEEFLEESMKQFTEFNLKHGYPTVADCKIILREIAEQMKEVGE